VVAVGLAGLGIQSHYTAAPMLPVRGMSSKDFETSLIPLSDARRAWRIVTWAGFLGSIYYILCVNGAPRIKFLTALNATAFDFGMIAGLGSFAICLQILGSMLSNRLQYRKSVWMALTITHRVVFTGVLVAPWMFENERIRIWWIIFVIFLHDGLAQGSGPLWLSWMADLVPKATMTRHWASRQRFITAANMVVMAFVALSFHYFELTGRVILGFVLMAALGIVVGVIDIIMFRWVPEPPNERVQEVRPGEALLQPLRDKSFRPFLYFMSYWQFAVATAAPFFGLYMIDFLGLSVLTVQLLGISSALGVVMSSHFWGLVCDTYGYRPVLQMLTFGKFLTPLHFLLAPPEPAWAIPYLMVMLFIDGVLNAGVQLANQGVLLKATPRRNRTMYIAATNFLSIGLMAGIAPILAGGAIDRLNETVSVTWWIYTFTGYHIIFAISSVLRGMACILASRIHEPSNVSLRTVLQQLSSAHPLRTTQLVYRLHESPHEHARLMAARSLGELRNPMAINELINALTDTSRPVREAAADSLGRIGVAEAVEPLAQALFDAESGIQARAARALGYIGGVDSIKALLANLRSQDTATLSETIHALARIKSDVAVLPLIGLFHSVQDEEVRGLIVTALGELSHTPSYDEVLHLLRGRRPADQANIR
jgi:MFS family permease